MNLAFTEEQQALHDTARSFLARTSGSEQVRSAMASEIGHDPAVWKQLGAELGWTAVLVPEAHGGLGLGMVELAALMEPMGEALLCAPFLASGCLAVAALCEAGSEAQREAHLPGLAEGETIATLAVPGASGLWDPEGVEARFARDGDDWVLGGGSRYVLDGHVADLVVVAARGEDGVGLFLVPRDAAGLACEALPTMDATRRLAALRYDGVRLPADARLPGGDAAGLRRILDLGAVALAAELVGVARRALDLAVAHANDRVQFGRPIGSFQAVKHACADMMVRVESARSAAYHAACVADDASAEGRAALGRAAALAKATASEAAFRCAADCLQVHGGVGFTWEVDVHLLLKRARAGEALLGDPAFHRERVARWLLDEGGG